ncbi:MAG: FMN-binding glutamate synthase family protein, partial [Gammaproteobacteria bacterium]|nr:FMN-binding glutamate synthase family protein [Gammaproteobacteria bacterium]
MNLSLLSRYAFFACCVLFTLVSLLFLQHEWLWPFTLLGAVLSLVGIGDLLQKRHAVRRNYPILGNIRYLVEGIRPEIRQYLLEGDAEQLPFSRSQRSLVYSRAKNEGADKPFGTLRDVYQNGFEFISHSMCPAPLSDPCGFRVEIGGPQCRQPYSASLFNVSAMSFGSLSANAIRALNQGAKLGDFYHDTGEGSISPYHREHGGDLVWELGSGYFGCRSAEGRFDPERFAVQARDPQVKMIEIKLSQGAKPGHGGILPKHKITAEIASTRGVPMGEDCVSPSRHSAFSTPIELLQFIAQLRELSGGKPVGFKFCLGHPWEFMGIAKAMLETGILPDFIVVDGKEGGTGAAPLEFTDHLGVPLREGLLFVHNTLVGSNLRDKIKLGASGKIVSAFDIARVLAIGADWANSARGFMFAIGCIQSQSCHTNKCPTGVATQDPLRQRALVVEDKAQ